MTASLLESAPQTAQSARARLRQIAASVGKAAGLPAELMPRWAGLADLIADDSVEQVFATPGGQPSAVNGTGVPVQFSVVLDPGARTARMMGEAGASTRGVLDRLKAGGRQARALLEFLGFDSAIPAVDQVFAHLLPRNTQAMRSWTGALWCGATLAPDGSARVRLYLNQRHGSVQERVDRLAQAVRLVAGDPLAESWRQGARFLGETLLPYGVALDISRSMLEGVRVYCAAQTASVEAIAPFVKGARRDADLAACAQFIEDFRPLGGWTRPWMVMPCLEFRQEKPVRAKVDLALCALAASDAALDETLRWRLDSMGLAAEPYAQVLAAVSARPLSGTAVERLQYLSAGCDPHRREVTVYLSPDLRSETPSASGERM